MEDTKTIPIAMAPALKRVWMPFDKAISKLPFTASRVAKYIPPPGTRGIIPQIINMVTGVLYPLAIISEKILTTIAARNNEKITEGWSFPDKRYVNQPRAPPTEAIIKFLPLILNRTPKPIELKKA